MRENHSKCVRGVLQPALIQQIKNVIIMQCEKKK